MSIGKRMKTLNESQINKFYNQIFVCTHSQAFSIFIIVGYYSGEMENWVEVQSVIYFHTAGVETIGICYKMYWL